MQAHKINLLWNRSHDRSTTCFIEIFASGRQRQLTHLLATCSNLQPLNISTHLDMSQLGICRTASSCSLTRTRDSADSLGRAMEGLGIQAPPSKPKAPRALGRTWEDMGGHGRTMRTMEACEGPVKASRQSCHIIRPQGVIGGPATER